MLALELEKADVKEFMGKLLREGLFDAFEARSVEIATSVKITVDGTQKELSSWESLRPLVYEIIKLCPKPKYVKIIFSRKDAEEIHKNAAALFLNLTYENDGVTFTTAAAQKEFALDKSHDDAWDNYIREFFNAAKINVSDR